MNAEQMIREAAKVSTEYADDTVARLAFQIGMLESFLRNTYSTTVPRPDKASGQLSSWVGGEPVIVEYDYEAGQAGKLSGPPEDCYEGIDPEVGLISVWVRGAELDPEEFDELLRESWVQAVIDSENEAAEYNRGRNRYDDERDFAVAV